MLKVNMIVKFVAVGVSFRQARRLYQTVKEETGMGVLGNITDKEVSNICRTICAINLQSLKELLKDCWAFSIGLDGGNNAGSAYLDIRMRCYYKDNLHNFHLLAIPMRERHTGQYQFDLVVTALDVFAPNWRYQLIGVTSDGASTMTGCIQGTCTRLARECHTTLFRIWCGAHQLDLVMKKAFGRLCNDRFLNVVTGVTGYLRRQQNLMAEMKSMCPTFACTRRISMGKLLKWLTEKRTKLLQYLEQKKPSCIPSNEWWIIISLIQPPTIPDSGIVGVPDEDPGIKTGLPVSRPGAHF
jgi:hypothetical protein